MRLVKHLLFLLEVHRSLIEHDDNTQSSHISSVTHFQLLQQARGGKTFQFSICIRIKFRILITTTHSQRREVYFYFCCVLSRAKIFQLLLIIFCLFLAKDDMNARERKKRNTKTHLYDKVSFFVPAFFQDFKFIFIR